MNSDNLEKNEIIEIDENEEITNTQYDIPKVKESVKTKKTKKPMSKKTKIIIIVSAAVILLVAVAIILFFVFDKEEEIKEPVVVIEKDNYRYEDGKLIFIDKNKSELGEYECSNKNDSLCYVAYLSNEDKFDEPKRVYESGLSINVRSDIYSDKYVFIYDSSVKEDGEIYLYDIKKKEKLGTYSLIKEVSDTEVIVKSSDGYNLFDISKEEVVFDKSYDYLGFISDSKYLVAANNNNYKLIDFNGEDVSKSVPGEIKAYGNKAISVQVGGKIYIYNYDGEKIIDEDYDYARFSSDYVIALDGKKLYVYDNLGNKMTGEAIRIGTTDYNTKLIFSEALRQIGKEEAFVTEVNGTNMKISFEDEVVSINLLEGEFNKESAYISYFAGKLYFYKDLEKTELLGSYACEFKNSISSDTKTLDNCFIATESNILKPTEDLANGYIPIYNDRYIFIKDVKSINDKKIVLYDLKDKKKLASYKEVDVGVHNIENEITFIDTAGTHVACKNTSDYYGVINIGSSSVKGVIAFKDDGVKSGVKYNTLELKLLNDYYLTKRDDGTYHLFDANGKELASKVSTKYEIVEYKYNYLMVKNNDKYLIYDLLGKIVSDEFKYIKLEEQFYVTLNDTSLLGIYKYSDKTNLIKEDIKISDVNKDLNYVVKNNIITITHPTEVGKTIKIDLNEAQDE